MLRESVPTGWAGHVQALPFGAALSPAEARRIVAYARTFESETYFEGCGGLDLSEEIVRSIALQACRLILNLEQDHYRKVRTVLVYPRAFEFTPEDSREATLAFTSSLLLRQFITISVPNP